MTDETPEAQKPRSKRVYVYWGAAFALLLALGFFCWLVVRPVMQVRQAVGRFGVAARGSSSGFHYSYRHADVLERVRELGGEERALRKLALYVKMPEKLAPRPSIAILLMGGCGPGAEPLLSRYARGGAGPREQQAAAQALWQLRSARKREKDK